MSRAKKVLLWFLIAFAVYAIFRFFDALLSS